MFCKFQEVLTVARHILIFTNINELSILNKKSNELHSRINMYVISPLSILYSLINVYLRRRFRLFNPPVITFRRIKFTEFITLIVFRILRLRWIL